MTNDQTVTQADQIPGDVWAEVDAVAGRVGNNEREYAQCVDRLRCALAQQLHLHRTAHSGEGREGAEYCRKCGRDNPSWSAPSPLWNAVMRGGSIDGNPIHDDLVCPSCFIGLAMDAGIASGWRLIATEVNVPLETVTPSGRAWDDAAFLWDEQHSSHSGEGRSNGAGKVDADELADLIESLRTENARLTEERDALAEASAYLIDRLTKVSGGIVVRDLEEARGSYDAALAKVKRAG